VIGLDGRRHSLNDSRRPRIFLSLPERDRFASAFPAQGGGERGVGLRPVIRERRLDEKESGAISTVMDFPVSVRTVREADSEEGMSFRPWRTGQQVPAPAVALWDRCA
jgi:hypothetical protein